MLKMFMLKAPKSIAFARSQRCESTPSVLQTPVTCSFYNVDFSGNANMPKTFMSFRKLKKSCRFQRI